MDVSNWKSQIRKGLIEYGLLNLVEREERVYGLEMLEAMKIAGLQITEGTLYPLLSRLVKEKLLLAQWETKNLSGHPRKYYQLSVEGRRVLQLMNAEWKQIELSIENLKSKVTKGEDHGREIATKTR